MKKLIFAIITVLGLSHAAKSEDLITATLLDHVGTVTQFYSGGTKLALTDSVVLIGNIKGKSIVDLQAGFNQNADGTTGDKWIGGAFLKISTLIQDKVIYPEHWKFLNSLEHGPFLFYGFEDKVWRGGYQCGLAFGLNPK